MHSFVKPGLFHISAETTECLIFFGLKTFRKVVSFVFAIIAVYKDPSILLTTLLVWYTPSASLHCEASGTHSWLELRGGQKYS